MSLLPHKVLTPSNAPLHSILLSFGKGLLKRNGEGTSLKVLSKSLNGTEFLNYQDVSGIEKRAREQAIKQLATILRMQSEESDDVSMLNSLESLVLAGEISASDFVGRLKNLFPRAMTGLDVSMQMKLAVLIL